MDISSASPQYAISHALPQRNMTLKSQERTLAKAHPHGSLLSLPAELIEQIASYLDLPKLRALRLTASRYHRQTTHIFRQNFFTARNLQWTRASLQRLVDISAHPDLGSACRHLVIDATPHHALMLWEMRRRSADAGHMTPITDDEDGSKLVERLNEDYATLQQKAEDAAKFFNETRFDVKCLTTVFSCLVSLESITFAYQGMGARYSKFGGRYCEISQHEMSRPFISILSALAASGNKVKHIKTHSEERYGAISIGRLESLAPSLRCFDTVFEILETLDLNLRDWRSPDSGFEIETTRAPFVVRFLAKCRNVKVLELSCYSALEDNLFRDMARTCRLTQLHRCKLDSFRLSQGNDLIDFLTPSSDSLKELQLLYILNADPEVPWAELFTSLGDSTSCLTGLRSLSVTKLFSQRGLESTKRVLFQNQTRLTYSLLIEGEDWQAQLNDQGSKYVELEAGRMWDASATRYPFKGLDERVWPL